MSDTILARVQLRRGTLAQWTSANPVLLAGEAGYETDTGILRIGDGTTAFLSLPVASLKQSAITTAFAGRSVSAGGLATGGGDLSEDRAITVPIASKAQAETGTNNTTAMTPLRTAEAIAEQAPAETQLSEAQVTDPDDETFGTVNGVRLAAAFDAREQQFGVGQTWQDVLASRTHSTSYQNTTGRPIAVFITISGATERPFQVSEDNSVWIVTGSLLGGAGGDFRQVHSVVPPDHYYRVDGDVGSFFTWSELR